MSISAFVAFKADNVLLQTQDATNRGPGELSKLNQRIHDADDIFKSWAINKGGQAVAIGNGDGIVQIGADHLEQLYGIKEQYEKKLNCTVSIGVGRTLEEAERAKTYSVKSGGNAIELYSDDLADKLVQLDQKNEESRMNMLLDKAEPNESESLGGGNDQQPEQQSAQSESVSQDPNGDSSPQPPEQQDLHNDFSSLADHSEQKESDDKQAAAQQQQQQDGQETLKQSVVEVLKEFKDMDPMWEQLKQADKGSYKVLQDLMQVVIKLAKQTFQIDDQQPKEPMQKADNHVNAAMGVGHIDSPSPNGTRTSGRIKIMDIKTGKTKWRMARAGMVMDPQGQPTSARMPNPK